MFWKLFVEEARSVCESFPCFLPTERSVSTDVDANLQGKLQKLTGKNVYSSQFADETVVANK
jgi:hypothetical protein